VLLTLAGMTYHPEMIFFDDAYITFRYGENLAAGHGFVYNPGENFLGTSAPLFGLVLGAGKWLTPLSILQLSVVLHLASLLALSVTAWLLFRDLPLRPLALLLPYLLICNPLVRLTSGMETLFFMALGFLTLLLCVRKRSVGAGICAALLCLTRPDGIFLAAILFLYQWARDRRFPVAAVVSGLAAGLPWLVFATAMYGNPIPATLGAKYDQASAALWAQDFFTRLHQDVVQRPENLWWIAAPAAMAISLVRRHRIGLLTTLWLLVHNGAYILTRVPGYLHYYIPILVQAAFLSLLLPARMPLDRWLPNTRLRWKTVSCLGVTTVAVLFLALEIPRLRTLPAKFRTENLVPRHVHYYHIGKWLDHNAPPDATVAAVEVGMVGYFANRTLIDFLGLVTPDVSDRVADRSNIDFVMTRHRPDYVVGNQPLGGHDVNILQYLDGSYHVIRNLGGKILLERNKLDEIRLADKAAEVAAGIDGTVYFGDFPLLLDFDRFSALMAEKAPGTTFSRMRPPAPDHVLQLKLDSSLVLVPVTGDAWVRFGPDDLMRWNRTRLKQPERTPEGVRFTSIAPVPVLCNDCVNLKGPFRRIRLRLRVEDLAGMNGGDSRIHLKIRESGGQENTAHLTFTLRRTSVLEDLLVRIPFGGITHSQELRSFRLDLMNRQGVVTLREIVLERF